MSGSPHSAALLLGIVTLLALLPTLVAARRALRRGDWDLTSTLVFLVGITGSLPMILVVIHSGQSERLDPYGNVIVTLPDWALQIGQATKIVLIVAALLFFAGRMVRGARLNAAPCVAIALLLALAFSDALNGRQVFAHGQVVLLAVLLAATVARPGRSACLGAAAVGLVLALLGGIEALVEGDSVFRECRSDKCGMLGTLHTGLFTNENMYGQLVALSVPFVWLALRGSPRVILALYVAFTALATGSRTAMVTVTVTLVFLLLLRPKLSEDISTGHRSEVAVHKVMGAVGLSATALLGFLLPFLLSSGDTVSQRAYFWHVALEQVPMSPLYGFGAKAWEQLYPSGEIPVSLSYSPHNEWLDILYAGGLIGVALFVALLVVILLRGGGQNFTVACCVLLPVLIDACAERPWSFGIYDWLSFTLLAATLVPVPTRPPAPAPSLHGSAVRGSSSAASIPCGRPL